MPLTKIQVELFRDLLDQLSPDYFITEVDVLQIHAYLFEQPLSLDFPAGSPLIEIITYLREIIVSQCLDNIEELICYYEQKSKKIDDFLDDLVEQYQGSINSVLELDYTTLLREKLMENTYFGGYNRLSGIHVNSYNQLKLTCNIKTDIYSTIKRHLQSSIPSNKCITINYSLPSGEWVDVVGKNYLEQFSAHKNVDCIFVMKFDGPLEKSEHFALCESKMRRANMVDWIMHYYSSRQAPDYYGIIDVVRKEQTISDSNFKFMLFEWLIYSKLIISDYLYWEDNPIREVAFSANTVYPIFNYQDIYYYSGHGYRGWINLLLETKLSGKKWSILKRPERLFWLTSDNPGFMININEVEAGRKERQPAHSVTEIRPDTVLYYPLSKDYCLRIEPICLDTDQQPDNSPIKFEPASEGELNFVNELTISTHREMVIASQKKMLKQYKHTHMATNGTVGDAHRNGQVKERSQTFNPKTETWIKRDTSTGRFIDGKADCKPFKGVRKEK